MNQPEQPRRPGNLGPIATVLVPFVLLDLIGPSVIEGSSPDNALAALLLGAIIAQPGLLAVWAVLGPQRLLVRWSLSLLAATLLCCTLALGIAIARGADAELGESIRGTLMLPLILLAVQLPLWILRAATGWCIVIGGTEDYSMWRQSRQFRLQHILGATTVIAIALALARLGLPGLDNPNDTADPLLWLRLMLGCLLCGLWSAFSVLPCLWGAFVARNKIASTVAVAAYAVLMSVVVAVVICGIVRPPPRIDEVVWFVCLFHGGLVLALLGGLHIARLCGYVLLRPGRMQPSATPTGTSPLGDSSGPTRAAEPNDLEGS